MSSPYIGEIRLFAGNFAPMGWALCDGLVLPISENEALFNLIGTTYGGDGISTFALPDLRSRVPVHQGTGINLSPRVLGSGGGVEQVTLTAQTMPAHRHAMAATTTNAVSRSPVGAVLASSSTTQFYGAGDDTTAMAAGVVTAVGGNQPHNNVAPVLAVNFIIALEGIYPSAA